MHFFPVFLAKNGQETAELCSELCSKRIKRTILNNEDILVREIREGRAAWIISSR